MRYSNLTAWISLFFIIFLIYSFIPQDNSIDNNDIRKIKALEQLALEYPYFYKELSDIFRSLYFRTREKVYYDISYEYIRCYEREFDEMSEEIRERKAEYLLYNREFSKAKTEYVRLFSKDIKYAPDLFASILWDNSFNNDSDIVMSIIEKADNVDLLGKIYDISEYNEKINYYSLKRLCEYDHDDEILYKYLEKRIYYSDYDYVMKNVGRLKDRDLATGLLLEIQWNTREYGRFLKTVGNYAHKEKYSEKIFRSLLFSGNYSKALEFGLKNIDVFRNWDNLSRIIYYVRETSEQDYIRLTDLIFEEFPERGIYHLFDIYRFYINNGQYSKALDYIRKYSQNGQVQEHLYNFLVLSKGNIDEKDVVEIFVSLPDEKKKALYYTIPALRKIYSPEDIFDDNNIIASFYLDSGNVEKSAFYLEKAGKFYESAVLYRQLNHIERSLSVLENIKEDLNKDVLSLKADIYIAKGDKKRFLDIFEKIKDPGFYISWYALEIFRENNDTEKYSSLIDYIENNFFENEAVFLVLYSRKDYSAIIKEFEKSEEKEKFIDYYFDALYNMNPERMDDEIDRFSNIIPDENLNYYRYLSALYRKDYKNIYKYGLLSKGKAYWYDILRSFLFSNEREKAHDYLLEINRGFPENSEFVRTFYYISDEIRERRYDISFSRQSEYIDITEMVLSGNYKFDMNYKELRQKESVEYRNFRKDIIIVNYMLEKDIKAQLYKNGDTSGLGMEYGYNAGDFSMDVGINLLSDYDRQIASENSHDFLKLLFMNSEDKRYQSISFEIDNLRSLGINFSATYYNELRIKDDRSFFFSVSRGFFDRDTDYSDYNELFNGYSALPGVVDSYYNRHSASIRTGISYQDICVDYIRKYSFGLYSNLFTHEYGIITDYSFKRWDGLLFEIQISIDDENEKNFQIKAGNNFE